MKKHAPVLLSLVLILIAAATAISRLHFEENIHINAGDDELSQLIEPYLQRNKSKIVFSMNLEKVDDLYEAEEWAEEFIGVFSQGDSISHLSYRSDFDAFLFDQYVTEHPYYYLEDSDYMVIDSILQHSDEALESVKNQLSNPSSMGSVGRLRRDPLGISPLAYQHIGALWNASEQIQREGLYLSADGKYLLIQGQLNFDAEDMTALKEFIPSLEQRLKKWNEAAPTADFFGYFTIAHANAVQMKRDIILTVNLALVLIVGLLIYYYRSLKTILFFTLPGVFGVACALAVIYLIQGEISILALSAGAIIMGIVVDYSFHYFSHLQSVGDPYRTRKQIAIPLVTSSVTTIAAFVALLFARAEMLRDFGLFTAFSLAFTLLFILFFLPTLIDLAGRKSDKPNAAFQSLLELTERKNIRLKWWGVLGFAVLTGVFFHYSSSLSFSGNLRDLNYYPEALKAKEVQMLGINPDEQQHINILTHSSSTEDAFQRNRALYSAMVEMTQSNPSIRGNNLGGLLIPDSLAEVRYQRWIAFWQTRKTDFKSAFEEQLQESGFSAKAFEPFWKTIKEPDHSTLPAAFALQFESVGELVMHDGENYILSTITLPLENYRDLLAPLEELPGVIVMDGSQFATRLAESIRSDFNTLIWLASIIVFVTMLLIYGRIELTLISFLPMVLSWVWILGISHLLNIEFNFINVMIASVIFGLGDDYAIFITDGLMNKNAKGSKVLAEHKAGIALSSVSTIIGTGVLFLGVHPAIHSIAPVTVLGISLIAVFSFALQPLLFRMFISNRTENGKPPYSMFELIMSVYAFSLFFVGSLTTTLVTALIILFPAPRKAKQIVVHRLIQAFTGVLINTVFNVRKRYFQMENLNFDKPSIIIANHSSFLDILSLAMRSPKLIIMVGPWVYNSPIFGWFIRYADYLPAFKNIEENLDKAQELIDRGYSIVVFPEGHRSPDGVIRRFHKGAYFLSEKLNVDITPVLLHGFHYTLPKGEYYVKSSFLDMKVLPRISPTDQRFTGNYSQRGKQITAYFKEEHARFTQEAEGPEYWRYPLQTSYLFKGPVLEWYFRIKYRFEKENYEKLHQWIPQDATVYDLGCGYGFSSYYLSLKGPERSIFGIDYDADKIAVAQNSYLKSAAIDFATGDVTKVELEPCNAVIISDVLHYLNREQQADVIRRTWGSLRAGGQLIIKDALVDHEEKHAWTERSERWSTRWIQFNKTTQPLNFLSKADMKQWTEELGAELEFLHQSENSSNTWMRLVKH